MSLDHLALARATVDRAAYLRSDQPVLDWLDGPVDAVVLPVAAGRAPVLDAGPEPDDPQLVLSPGRDVAAAMRAHRDSAGEDPSTGNGPEPEVAGWSEPIGVLLGADAGRRYLGVLWPSAESVPELGLPAGTRWAGLREVGALLDDAGAGLLTAAIALANWHATHQRCPRCGAPTDVIQSGWVRRCPRDGSEHFPRTDPAVIMSIVDPEDRILLGRQAVWPERRYSTLAGFVEPGESCEAAVRREVAEESGIEVGAVTYLGSQPWPFPASLMLGFTGRARTTEVRVDGRELSDARWWSREQLRTDISSGALLLPPAVSIARRLIENWYGGPIRGAGEAWR